MSCPYQEEWLRITLRWEANLVKLHFDATQVSVEKVMESL